MKEHKNCRIKHWGTVKEGEMVQFGRKDVVFE